MWQLCCLQVTPLKLLCSLLYKVEKSHFYSLLSFKMYFCFKQFQFMISILAGIKGDLGLVVFCSQIRSLTFVQQP